MRIGLDGRQAEVAGGEPREVAVAEAMGEGMDEARPIQDRRLDDPGIERLLDQRSLRLGAHGPPHIGSDRGLAHAAQGRAQEIGGMREA